MVQHADSPVSLEQRQRRFAQPTMARLPPVPSTFTSAIGSRQFEACCEGVTSLLLVEVGQPVQDAPTVEGLDWRCPVRFTHGESVTVRSACGMDSLQALQMAFEVIRTELRRLAAAGYTVSVYGQPLDLELSE